MQGIRAVTAGGRGHGRIRRGRIAAARTKSPGKAWSTRHELGDTSVCIGYAEKCSPPIAPDSRSIGRGSVEAGLRHRADVRCAGHGLVKSPRLISLRIEKPDQVEEGRSVRTSRGNSMDRSPGDVRVEAGSRLPAVRSHLDRQGPAVARGALPPAIWHNSNLRGRRCVRGSC